MKADNKFRELPNGEISYKGNIYPGTTGNKFKVEFNPKEFFKNWEEIIKNLDGIKLDYNQIQRINEDFIHSILSYGTLPQMYKKHQQINNLRNKLNLALEKTYSNYRDSRDGFWGFILGLFAHKAIEKINFPNMLK